MAELDRCIEAIEDIVASPKVEGFIVGFTAGSISNRRAQYRAVEYRCVMMLADRLTRGQAHGLEEALHDWAKTHGKWGKDADDTYRRSAGGVGGRRKDEPIHGVYVAWW